MTQIAALRMTLHSRIVFYMRRAGWQASYKPAVDFVKHTYCLRAYGVRSSTELSEEQLRAAINEWTLDMKIEPPSDKHFAIPTDAELRKIVRLGKYRLGAIYGDDWFWRHLPDWTAQYYDQVDTSIYPRRSVKRLQDLSAFEAEHVIRVLEQIERKCRSAA